MLPLQWLPLFSIGGYEVRHVGILTDVLPTKMLPPSVAKSLNAETALPDIPKVKPAFVDSCPKGMVCIEDYAYDAQRGMQPFYEALSLRNEMDRPVRIAYFGDSFIEVDILTADLRALLQERFGGCGVGFLDIDPPYAFNRATVWQKSGGWTSHCVLEKTGLDAAQLNIGQRYFRPQGTAWTEVHGVRQPRLDTTEVHTLYLRTNTPLHVGIKLDDGPMYALQAKGNGRVEALTHTARSGQAKWQVTAGYGTICWGIAEEGRQGVSLDNLSLRGSNGHTLIEIPEQTLSEMGEVRPYDLIVLQFGLNVANKKQTDYSGYARQLQNVVELLKRSFPTAGILLVGVGDREDRFADGQLHTMTGIKALMRYQQNVAADCNVAFWNLFDAMGGEGSIRRMAEAKPAEAGKDYTHINARGGKRIAQILFKSIIHGYEQYQKRKAYEAE